MSFKGQYNVADLIGNPQIEKVEVSIYGTRNGDHEDPDKHKLQKIYNYIFDLKGNIIECVTSNPKSSSIYVEKQVFNSKNQSIEYFRYYPDDKTLVRRDINKYDPQNVVLSSIRTLYKKDDKELKYLTLGIYKEKETLKDYLDYIQDGFVYSTVNIISEKNQIIKSISLNNKGETTRYSTHEYNEKGFKTCTSYFNSSDVNEKKTTYEYDDRNNLVNEITYDIVKDSVEETIQNSYNDSNLKIKIRVDVSGIVANDIFAYSYNKKQNWNERFGFSDIGSKVTICKRKIKYR